MLRVIVVGLGPIGVACARAIGVEHDMRLVGLVDSDPAKLGRSLDELNDPHEFPTAAEGAVESEYGNNVEDGLRVAGTVSAAAIGGADLAILTTASRFERCVPAIAELLGLKLHVVSSCEEMAWPWYAAADPARQIDAQAQRAGRVALGTGVNPGFILDYLPVVLSSMVRRVKSVRCIRRVDASLRRLPLQAKIGGGLTPQEFESLARAGKIGHMGLAESAAMLASGLGHQAAPGSVRLGLEPVLADRPIQSALGLIEPGRVCGAHSTAAWANDQLSIELDLTMALGLPEPRDVIELRGPVPLRLKISGGIPGDSATVAGLLNCARAVGTLAPGLRTMLDLPPAGCRGRDR